MRFFRKGQQKDVVSFAEEFRFSTNAQRGSMPIDMNVPWYCRRCRKQMLHRGVMLICPDSCGSVLPTDSDDVAYKAVLSPHELDDEPALVASRALYVDRVAAQAAPCADVPSDHA